MLDLASDKNSFEANVMVGSQLCSRRLLQQIIYCVGGVSVFFPLIAQCDRYENEESGFSEPTLLIPISKERLTAEVIELITSVLDDNLSNQQQMHLLSGFSVLGFLLQSVPPQQLNLETFLALKSLFHVIANCGMYHELVHIHVLLLSIFFLLYFPQFIDGLLDVVFKHNFLLQIFLFLIFFLGFCSGLADLLLKEAISNIFLNPLIWLYTDYKVQREMYLFIVQKFDDDPRLHRSLCRLPRVIDIICQFYWDNAKFRFAVGSKPLLHPITKQVIGERPSREEIRKIRLLLLGLGELSLKYSFLKHETFDAFFLSSFFFKNVWSGRLSFSFYNSLKFYRMPWGFAGRAFQ